jgi:hypothetical protein
VNGQTEAVTFAASLQGVIRPIKQSGALCIEIRREQQSEKIGIATHQARQSIRGGFRIDRYAGK